MKKAKPAKAQKQTKSVVDHNSPLTRCARLANGALTFLGDMVTDKGAPHMSKTTMAFLKVAITAVSEVRKSLEQEMSK